MNTIPISSDPASPLFNVRGLLVSALTLFLMVVLSSCSSLEDATRTGILSGAGAVAGYGLSDGDPLVTGLGAAAGGAGAIMANEHASTSKREHYLDGFVDGQANALKQKYWQEKDRHSAPEEPPLDYRYYDVAVPGHRRSDGVLIAPHTRTIEIVE